jgi:hypothetical protein
MSKIEVTDEMVERAMGYRDGWFGRLGSKELANASLRASYRAWLEVVLNPPPPEPNDVTQEMRDAARRLALGASDANTEARRNGHILDDLKAHYLLEPSDFDNVYRAMRKLEPKRSAAAPNPIVNAHVRRDDPQSAGGTKYRLHHRKDDKP